MLVGVRLLINLRMIARLIKIGGMDFSRRLRCGRHAKGLCDQADARCHHLFKQGSLGNSLPVELDPDDTGSCDLGFEHAALSAELGAEAACSPCMEGVDRLNDQVSDPRGDLGADALSQLAYPLQRDEVGGVVNAQLGGGGCFIDDVRVRDPAAP